MKISEKLLKIANKIEKMAKSGTVSIAYDFEHDDFDIEKLEVILKKSGINLSEVAKLDDEVNIEELTKKFWDALSDWEIEAKCYFSTSRDSEGYPEPDESDIDVSYPNLKLLGKSIDIENVIEKRTKQKIEDKLFETFMDEY